jgi:two-component system response regulator DctR
MNAQTAPPPADGTVYLADDEAALRDALGFLFAAHGLQVQAFDNGGALLDALAASSVALPACILLDVRMDPMSGLQVFDELRRRGNPLPVIFLSGHGDIAMAVDALKLGAFDFIEKPFHDAVLIERVRKALDACNQAVAHQSSARALQARIEGLSARERELMHHVAAGKLNKIIADEMHISVRTVEVHRSRVFAKLGVRSAAELATLLARTGL